MPERKSILLRLDPAVHDALARWAAAELRSTTAQIEYLLRQGLAQAGRLPRDVGGLPRRGRPPKGHDPAEQDGSTRDPAERDGTEQNGGQQDDTERDGVQQDGGAQRSATED
ncbi:MAG TPA: hypothetical protein VH372_05280 [Actinospica sp.]|nr:hypothetical protein [Actinospica sp.]